MTVSEPKWWKAGEDMPIYSDAGSDRTTGVIKAGQVFKLGKSKTVDGRIWRQAESPQAPVGFLPDGGSRTPLQRIFLRERALVVTILGIVFGAPLALAAKDQSIGNLVSAAVLFAALGVSFFASCVWAAADLMKLGDGFFRFLPIDAPTPQFDSKRLLFEILMVAGTVAAMVGSLAIGSAIFGWDSGAP